MLVTAFQNFICCVLIEVLSWSMTKFKNLTKLIANLWQIKNWRVSLVRVEYICFGFTCIEVLVCDQTDPLHLVRFCYSFYTQLVPSFNQAFSGHMFHIT